MKLCNIDIWSNTRRQLCKVVIKLKQPIILTVYCYYTHIEEKSFPFSNFERRDILMLCFHNRCDITQANGPMVATDVRV